MIDKPEFEHYKFIADKGQNPLRIDRFLLNFIEFATRNKIQQSIKSNPMAWQVWIHAKRGAWFGSCVVRN